VGGRYSRIVKELEGLARGYGFNDKVLGRAISGLDGDDWVRRAGPETSHAYWVLGHLAASRRALLRNLGRDLPREPWEDAFARGSKPADAVSVTPSTLEADFLSSGTLIRDLLGAMTEEEASSAYPRKLPDGSDTRGGATRFFLWHESFHLGQLGILRRACGKPGIA
jgi:hypothetical protein